MFKLKETKLYIFLPYVLLIYIAWHFISRNAIMFSLIICCFSAFWCWFKGPSTPTVTTLTFSLSKYSSVTQYRIKCFLPLFAKLILCSHHIHHAVPGTSIFFMQSPILCLIGPTFPKECSRRSSSHFQDHRFFTEETIAFAAVLYPSFKNRVFLSQNLDL